MTSTTDFDRIVTSWLQTTDSGPIDEIAVSEALAIARRSPQRRGLRALLTAPAPWPNGGLTIRALPAAVRVAAVVALLVAALVTSAVVGGRLLRSAPVPPTPNHQLVTEPSPTATAPDMTTAPSARPLLGPAMSLMQKRPYGPTVVALPNSRVAILGGGIAEVEIWDPTSGHSTAAGALSSPRAEVTAAVLSDGRILVFGGFDARDNQQTRLTTAEIFDPATGTSTRTGDPGVRRMVCHCGTPFRDVTTIEAIPLLDGRLLVVGGAAQSEIFDLTLGTFRTVAGGCDASRGAAARLRDGRVLVTCLEGFARTEQGVAGPGTNKAELFDPATDTFVPIASPTTTDSGAATLLDDGKVLLTGPGLAQDTSPAEVFDPATNRFTQVKRFNSSQSPILLPDGRVLFVGYAEMPSGILDVRTLAFTPLDQAVSGAQGIATMPVALRDGSVLLVGADDTRLLDTSQI